MAPPRGQQFRVVAAQPGHDLLPALGGLAADGHLADLESPGDQRGRKLFDVAQQEDQSLSLAEFFGRRQQHPPDLGGLQALLGTCSGRSRQGPLGQTFLPSRRSPPEVGAGHVQGDPDQPGLHRTGRVEVRQSAVEAEKGLLGHVFGVLSMPRHPPCHGKHQPAVPGDEGVEGRRIAGAGLSQ